MVNPNILLLINEVLMNISPVMITKITKKFMCLENQEVVAGMFDFNLITGYGDDVYQVWYGYTQRLNIYKYPIMWSVDNEYV